MHATPEIRLATSGDHTAIAQLAVETGMFGADEVGELMTIFHEAVRGDLQENRWWVTTRPDGAVIAAAYLAPEPFADRVWNLYFLAVTPSGQGQGAGAQLIGHVEQQLRSDGESTARVLLVETSSTEQYAEARRFYAARGFAQEARIREYYGPGDDKIVFWKSLTA